MSACKFVAASVRPSSFMVLISLAYCCSRCALFEIPVGIVVFVADVSINAWDNALLKSELEIRAGGVAVEALDVDGVVGVSDVLAEVPLTDAPAASLAMLAKELEDVVPASKSAVKSWPRLIRRISAWLGEAVGESPSDVDDSSDNDSSPCGWLAANEAENKKANAMVSRYGMEIESSYMKIQMFVVAFVPPAYYEQLKS